MFVSISGNTTGVISGAGTANPSAVAAVTPSFSGVHIGIVCPSIYDF